MNCAFVVRAFNVKQKTYVLNTADFKFSVPVRKNTYQISDTGTRLKNNSRHYIKTDALRKSLLRTGIFSDAAYTGCSE